MAPPCPRSAARPRAVAGNRRSRPARRWCDCRRRARGGRSRRWSRRSAPARSRRQSRRSAADHDDVVTIGAGVCRCIVHIGTIDVPGGIFKPTSNLRFFHLIARRNAATADVQIEPIPDSTAGQMDQVNQQDSSSGIAADAGRGIFRAYLHGVGGRRRPDRAAGGRARALGGDVCLARGRAGDRRARWPDRAAAGCRAGAAELVGRGARSRGRFRHLRLRAGLCHHRKRPAAAAGGARCWASASWCRARCISPTAA